MEMSDISGIAIGKELDAYHDGKGGERMNSYGFNIFCTCFGFVVGGVFATVLSCLLMHKVLEQSFQSRLDDAGISLEHHYIEQDGVRTNWTDVVFLDDKGNKALTMHPFRCQATPIKEQGKR